MTILWQYLKATWTVKDKFPFEVGVVWGLLLSLLIWILYWIF